MITINYQAFGTKGFNLRLRIYQDGETKFIVVTKFLKGNLTKSHWNQRKQHFIPSAPYSSENNSILVKFRQKYDEMAVGWTGSVFGMIAAMEHTDPREAPMTISRFIHLIIERFNKVKHPDGSSKGTYENYLKCEKRIIEFCEYKNIKYDNILMKEVHPGFINNMLDWVENKREGKGLNYISKVLHSIIMKADKEGILKAEDFKNCRWKKVRVTTSQKCHTLSEEQCKRFAELDLFSITNTRYNELYRDFCLFILYTGQSVCDAVSLRYCDIQNIGGISHFVFKRRKISEKQIVPCTVPIGEEVQRIMDKWSVLSKDGYIFPIRSKAKLKSQTTNNGDIKHFMGNLNNWLKKIGKALGCKFPLHTYAFRHTAITRYVSKEIPLVYLANMMGTSVENIEKIYYNNHGDTSSRNKTLRAMSI